VLLVASPFVTPRRARVLAYVGLWGIVAALFAVGPDALGIPWLDRGAPTLAYGGLFVLDPFAVFFKVLFLAATFMVILMSMRFLDEEQAHHGEYYALLCFATLGMMVMASGNDLLGSMSASS